MKYAIGIKQLSHVPFRVRLTVFSCLPLFPSNLWNKEIKKIQVKQKLISIQCLESLHFARGYPTTIFGKLSVRKTI